ncbi:MAG: hypothetical protein K8R67_04285 [Desulfobacteraceae bacterium]|nr:hypothetical protein [Desulfobacteraceae bacterium]
MKSYFSDGMIVTIALISSSGAPFKCTVSDEMSATFSTLPLIYRVTSLFTGSLVWTVIAFASVVSPYPLVFTKITIVPSPARGISLSKETVLQPQSVRTLLIRRVSSPLFFIIKLCLITVPSGTASNSNVLFTTDNFGAAQAPAPVIRISKKVVINKNIFFISSYPI